ncbi:MAG: NYN domain-containing protein, partial [Bacteroidetes bacterium]|nr:NYN domain-containing protein [Bacteroidota bacterium]
MANYDRDLKLAVLIDADNVPYGAISEMMEEVGKYGIATYKRIYGDFTSNRLQGWKDVLNEHAITPMQQYSYTQGKNATDSALIIDAMDILYT